MGNRTSARCALPSPSLSSLPALPSRLLSLRESRTFSARWQAGTRMRRVAPRKSLTPPSNSFDGYEMRQYPSVKWACTELTYEREDAEEEVEVETDEAVATLKALQEYQSKKKDRKNRPQTKMFMKLFRYISGVNKEQDEVAMTAPVLTSMKLLEGNQITKEMCFYIEKKHQANPPTPVDPDVKIETNKEFTVYVHTFGGYAMKDAVNIREARKFAEVLDEAGEEVDKSVFYTAGYDSPMKFWNRRNEIMYLVPGGR